MIASRKRHVVRQCADRPSLGLYKSHNRRSSAPFICAEYRGCCGGNQERRPYTPNYLSRLRRRQKEGHTEIAEARPCTTFAERILAIDYRQNSPRDEIP